MADLTDIRRGLAANLRTVLTEGNGHVDPFFRLAPSTPCLQVVGPDGPDAMVKSDFGTGRTWQIAIEAVISASSEKGAAVLLDSLIDAVAVAVESDNSPSGSLFSRLNDDNTVTAAAPAADSVAFLRYRGPQPFQGGQTEKLLVASWLVEVQT